MDHYFDREHLNQFNQGKLGEDNKELWDKFLNYYGSALKDGELDAETKSLIALAVALAVDCPYCIEAYTTACMEMGFEKEELIEVLHVVSAMKAGANLAMGLQMKNLEDKLEF